MEALKQSSEDMDEEHLKKMAKGKYLNIFKSVSHSQTYIV